MSDEASFGYRKVRVDEKQGLVNRVFDTVASRYDLMNDAMSGGMHRAWKDAMVAWLAPPRRPRKPYHVVDVAGGTGDIAFRIARAIDQNGTVTVCDINAEMLTVGRARDERRLRPRT
ncbi:MAG: class I SAM-dependent methyltransferase, partial [Pseudomonadota bacterium]